MESSNSGVRIRLAVEADYESIYQIWLDGIENSFDISQFNEVDLKQKFEENFKTRNGIFNFWVAVDSDHTILGWQSLIKVSNHPFKHHAIAESSTYLKLNNRFKGLGKFLLNHALNEAEKSHLEYVIGFVALNNEAAKKITGETGWIDMGVFPPSKKKMYEPPKHFLVRPV